MSKINIFLVIFVFAYINGLNAKTYAIVDNQKITEKDLNPFLGNMPNANYDTLPKEIQKQILDAAIDRVILLKDAKSKKLKSTKEYKEMMGRASEEIILNIYKKNILDEIKVTDNQISQFYKDNKDKFVKPEMIEASHILLKTQKDANNIINALNKSKSDISKVFAKLAKEKSTGPSAKNEGKLGWFPRTQMVPEFSDAAFKLKKGSYSKEPVKTQFGYHVILVTDKKDSEVAALNQVKNDIENNIKFTKLKDIFEKKIAKLRGKSKIVIKSK